MKFHSRSCHSYNHVITRGAELSRWFLLLGLEPCCFQMVKIIKVSSIFTPHLSKLHETWWLCGWQHWTTSFKNSGIHFKNLKQSKSVLWLYDEPSVLKSVDLVPISCVLMQMMPCWEERRGKNIHVCNSKRRANKEIPPQKWGNTLSAWSVMPRIYFCLIFKHRFTQVKPNSTWIKTLIIQSLFLITGVNVCGSAKTWRGGDNPSDFTGLGPGLTL